LLLFADDAKCYRSIHNPLDSHSLQLDLHLLTIWSHKSHLYFKYKCNSIRFRPNPCSPAGNSYSTDNCITTDKFSHCDLGIIFSANNMSWRPHYEHIVAKAYGPWDSYAVLLNTQAQPKLRKYYIYMLSDHACMLIVLFSFMETLSSPRYCWREFNVVPVNLF